MPHSKLWEECLASFKDQLPPQQYNSWIKPLVFDANADQILITAPNSFTLKIIQERFLPNITNRAQKYYTQPIKIELRVSGKTILSWIEKCKLFLIKWFYSRQK